MNYYESEDAMYKGMYNDAYTYAEEVLNSASYVAVTGLVRSELESAV